jgi:peptidoglycan/LPS O-acetylase OafA/YrhL
MACTQGHAGVPIFFVISGYCIAASAEAVRGGSYGPGRFFLRRFHRIYPPYWILLALTLPLAAALPAEYLPGHLPGVPDVLVHAPDTLSPSQYLGAATLTEEWRPLLFGPHKFHFMNHTWTLCFEEQFYAVVGLILVFTRRSFYPVVAAVSAIVYLNITDLNALIGSRVGVDLNRWQMNLPGTFLAGLWLAFAAGVAVHYWVTRADLPTKRILAILLLGGIVWAVRPLDGLRRYDNTLSKSLMIAFAFALTLIALHRYDRKISESRWLAPVRYCGRMCFSLYLVHAVVCHIVTMAFFRNGVTSPVQTFLLTTPACLAASLVCGFAFHRSVERHFLNTRRSERDTDRRKGNVLSESARRDAENSLIRLPV